MHGELARKSAASYNLVAGGCYYLLIASYCLLIVGYTLIVRNDPLPSVTHGRRSSSSVVVRTCVLLYRYLHQWIIIDMQIMDISHIFNFEVV